MLEIVAWVLLTIVAGPVVVYTFVKCGTVAFFKGREYFENNRRNHG